MIGEETAPAWTPDQTFLSAMTGGGALFGEPLAKFSLSRKLAAQQMGCLAPALSPDAYAAFERGMTYPGVLNDTIITCWLCTLKDRLESVEEYKAGAFTPDRAINQPAAANEAARAWAEAHGITGLETAAFFEAWKVFLTIMFGIDAALFELAEENTGQPMRESPPPKAEPGHPKSPSFSRRSRGSAGKPFGPSGKKCPTPKPSTTA